MRVEEFDQESPPNNQVNGLLPPPRTSLLDQAFQTYSMAIPTIGQIRRVSKLPCFLNRLEGKSCRTWLFTTFVEGRCTRWYNKLIQLKIISQ